MSRSRTLPPTMEAPGHDGLTRHCLTMNECAISTATLPEGSFACVVLSRTGQTMPAAVFFLDRDEVEAHIALLRNAIEDAERIDAGKPPIHASPTLRRQ